MGISVLANFLILNFRIGYFRNLIQLRKKIIEINLLQKLQVLFAKHSYAIPSVKVYLNLG